MAKIVRFHETGDASVLKLEDVPVQEPGSGEVRIQVEAFALNRAEVYFREDQYIHAPKLPSRLGYDAASVVDAVGKGVTNVEWAIESQPTLRSIKGTMEFTVSGRLSPPMRSCTIPIISLLKKPQQRGCNT